MMGGATRRGLRIARTFELQPMAHIEAIWLPGISEMHLITY